MLASDFAPFDEAFGEGGNVQFKEIIMQIKTHIRVGRLSSNHNSTVRSG